MESLQIKEMVASQGELAEMKRIFSVIETSLLEKDHACLAVTSGVHHEGKTTIVAWLATTAARQNGKRVLAMDLHWYQPALHNCFDLNQTFDLDTLQQTASIKDLIQPSGIDQLDLMTAIQPGTNGNGTDADIYAICSKMINQAREAYDLVVVDTSPVYPPNRYMLDPTIIAKNTDGAVLVTLANVTPRRHLKRACMALETAGVNVVGVVVNHWKNSIH
jgi:capsular exopolysaccharide synthesis family protein